MHLLIFSIWKGCSPSIFLFEPSQKNKKQLDFEWRLELAYLDCKVSAAKYIPRVVMYLPYRKFFVRCHHLIIVFWDIILNPFFFTDLIKPATTPYLLLDPHVIEKWKWKCKCKHGPSFSTVSCKKWLWLDGRRSTG